MKKINVTRSSMPSFEEYCEEIKELWDSRWLTNMGVKHKKLQEELEMHKKRLAELNVNDEGVYVVIKNDFPDDSEV